MIISLDTETNGGDPFHGSRPFYVTTCCDKGIQRNWEWEVDLYTREVAIETADLREIEDLLEAADTIVTQHGKFDVRMLYFAGIKKFPWHKLQDTLIASHLLSSNTPHNLTDLTMQYLREDIEPYEKAIEKACNEARRMCRLKSFIAEHGEIALAKEGRPDMPSAGEKCWKLDMWLPRALARLLNYPKDHPWWTVLHEYANPDSVMTLALWIGAGLWHGMEAEIKRRDLWGYYKANLECCRVTWEMEQHGLTRSRTRAVSMLSDFEKHEEEFAERCISIARSTGYELDMPNGTGVNGSVRRFVFDHFRLPVVGTTEKGSPSLDKEALADWSVTQEGAAEEWVKAFLKKRAYSGAIKALESYEKYAVPLDNSSYADEYDVIHANINVTGAQGTTRTSSSNPNGQNVGRGREFEEDDEKLPSVRWVFGPTPDREWYAMDYFNIEMMIPAYYAGEKRMIELFEKPDEPPYFGSYHLLNASIIYPDLFWPLADKKGAFKELYKNTWYKWLKNFGFGVQYNCGELTADRAAHRKGSFRAVIEDLKALSAAKQRTAYFARRNGYVETLPDQSIHPTRGYPLLVGRYDDGSMRGTTPWNYVIQGTAGWAKKKALIRCDAQLKEWKRREKFDGYMLIELHDEILFSFPKRRKGNYEKAQRLRELMEQSGKDISIPLRVSVTYHPNNWADEEKFQ